MVSAMILLVSIGATTAMADPATTERAKKFIAAHDAKFKPLNNSKMVDDKAVFSQIDEATLDDIKSSTAKEAINAAVRIIIGIAAALALAFLLEYLDSSIRDEQDARRVLDMPVLGTIPRT